MKDKYKKPLGIRRKTKVPPSRVETDRTKVINRKRKHKGEQHEG